MITFRLQAVRLRLLGSLLIIATSWANAQNDAPPPEQPGIYFPQAPHPGEWRRSLGLVFTSTPPELTEETRISVPAIDFNLQRGVAKNLFIHSRIETQFVQSNLTLGVRWAKPVTSKFFIGAGYDVGGWFGALNIKDVFDSQAYGIQTYPNISAGYRLTRDLQLSAKLEGIFDVYYFSKVGSLAIEDKSLSTNGVAFSFVLEQPFYGKQHAQVGFRAAYSNFNWQFWSLYDTFDRNLLYPQLFFGFVW